MKGLLLALQFLTILPVRVPGRVSSRDVGRSTAFFPLAGLLKGGLLLLAYAALGPVMPIEVVSAILLTVSVLVNGGFHLDGLADTFDALASGKPLKERLDIMKDGTAGPAGITAIVLVLLLKYVLILEILSAGATAYLVLFPTAGAWSTVIGVFHGRSARSDGLGHLLIKESGAAEFAASAFLATAVFVSSGYLSPPPSLTASALLVAGIYLFTLILVRFFSSRFNGITGDNLGAVCELNEVFFLILAVALRGG